MEDELNFMKEHMSVLQGARVIDATAVEDEDGVFPVLLMRTPYGTYYQVDVAADPEFNGPGWMSIEKRDDLNDVA